MNFHEYVFSQPYLGWLIRGLVFTLWISALTTVCSVILGVAACAVRMHRRRSLRWVGRAYITLFRNIPPVPLLLLLVFGFPGLYRWFTGADLGVDMSFVFLVLGLSFNTSAYIADILRSGVMGIPNSQLDAARALGLPKLAVMTKIILPQALRITFPALGTRLIHNMKNSAVALVLPLSVDHMELMGQAGRIAGQTFSWAEPLIFAAVSYLLLSLLLAGAVSRLSMRFRTNIREAV